MSIWKRCFKGFATCIIFARKKLKIFKLLQISLSRLNPMKIQKSTTQGTVSWDMGSRRLFPSYRYIKYDIKNMKFILILISETLDLQDGFLHIHIKRCYDNR